MMTSCAAAIEVESASCGPEVSAEIKRFLDGKTSGGRLFQALYGRIGEEPIPERLLAVVRSARSTAEVVPIDPTVRRNP